MHRREQKTAKLGRRALCFSMNKEQDKEDLQDANHMKTGTELKLKQSTINTDPLRLQRFCLVESRRTQYVNLINYIVITVLLSDNIHETFTFTTTN